MNKAPPSASWRRMGPGSSYPAPSATSMVAPTDAAAAFAPSTPCWFQPKSLAFSGAMIPIFRTLFATEGLALGALGATEATDGAVDGAVDALGVAAAAQAPTMSMMAPRLAAQAESREWVGRLRTFA